MILRNKLRVFKNTVRWAMIGPRKEEVIEKRSCVFRSLMSALLTKCAGDQIEVNEKCWTRGMGVRRYAYTALACGEKPEEQETTWKT